MSTTLVTGATGRLGQLVVARLVEKGQKVRILTRRPEAAFALFGSRVEIASGSFADRNSLDNALNGTHRLFLLSPLSEALSLEQTAVIDAAVNAKLRRIVKISGSHWTIEPPGISISGDAHAFVERHLGKQPVEHVSIRPNAWMQVGLAAMLAQFQASGALLARYGQAAISHIDARDIADIAVHQLLAPQPSETPLIITGGEAVTTGQIADLIASHLHRPVGVSETGLLPEPDTDEGFEHRAVRQFMALIAAGHAAPVTTTVTQLLGRAPRTVAAFIAEHFAAVAAPTEKNT